MRQIAIPLSRKQNKKTKQALSCLHQTTKQKTITMQYIRRQNFQASTYSPTKDIALHEQVRLRCLIHSLELPSWWPNLPEYKWELDFITVELLGALPLTHFIRNCGCLDDLDAGEPDSVARSHLIVHLFNSAVKCCVTILLVHVVITSSALVPQPDTVVLDNSWSSHRSMAK